MKRHVRILDGLPILDIPQAAGEGGNTSWQTLAIVGTWNGHWMGGFSINANQLQQMRDSINSREIDTVVDYEHATLWSTKAPASGWLTKGSAELREDDSASPQLVAQIRWTNTAAEHIREQEYRYLSPVISWRDRDRVTGLDRGASIESVALTNVPFLHELPQVRLNSLRAQLRDFFQPEEDAMDREQFLALCKALNLDPESTTVEQVMQHVTALSVNVEILGEVRQTLGVEPEANVVETVRAMQQRATSVNPDEVAQLRTTVQEMQTRQTDTDAEAAVRQFQNEGKVAGDDTDNFKSAMAWAKKDLGAFKAYMATLQPFSVAPGRVQHTGNAGGSAGGGSLGLGEDADVEAQVLKNCRQMGMTEAQVKEMIELSKKTKADGFHPWGDPTLTAPLPETQTREGGE